MIKSTLRIFAVPLFSDNYSYIIQNSLVKDSLILVDPANPEVISDCLSRYFSKFRVGHILYTHKHWDHAGGASQLIEMLKKSDSTAVEVLSGWEDAKFIPSVTKSFEEDGNYLINGRKMNIYKVPCHTRGHTIYHFLPMAEKGEEMEKMMEEKMMTCEGRNIHQFSSDECAFTGDTLFSGGVGRFFEGNAHQMFNNLNKIHKNLSPHCHIYNGHEYTLQNLQWGQMAEPKNDQISSEVKELSESEPLKCTLPTTTVREAKINVFYRAAIMEENQLHVAPVEYLRILREAKNENNADLSKYVKNPDDFKHKL